MANPNLPRKERRRDDAGLSNDELIARMKAQAKAMLQRIVEDSA